MSTLVLPDPAAAPRGAASPAQRRAHSHFLSGRAHAAQEQWPDAFKAFEQAQGNLSSALSRLLVTVERYPQLGATAGYRDLQAQLEGTENRIAVERMRYSEVVRDYNTRLRLFPGSLVASLRGFKEKAYFEAAPGSQDAPKVKF